MNQPTKLVNSEAIPQSAPWGEIRGPLQTKHWRCSSVIKACTQIVVISLWVCQSVIEACTTVPLAVNQSRKWPVQVLWCELLAIFGNIFGCWDSFLGCWDQHFLGSAFGSCIRIPASTSTADHGWNTLSQLDRRWQMKSCWRQFAALLVTPGVTTWGSTCWGSQPIMSVVDSLRSEWNMEKTKQQSLTKPWNGWFYHEYRFNQ